MNFCLDKKAPEAQPQDGEYRIREWYDADLRRINLRSQYCEGGEWFNIEPGRIGISSLTQEMDVILSDIKHQNMLRTPDTIHMIDASRLK